MIHQSWLSIEQTGELYLAKDRIWYEAANKQVFEIPLASIRTVYYTGREISFDEYSGTTQVVYSLKPAKQSVLTYWMSHDRAYHEPHILEQVLADLKSLGLTTAPTE